ncbi:MAG: hypothetical protein WC673_00200 [Candidatus Paceibacterota bacterium]|jgi:hypothetical protein
MHDHNSSGNKDGGHKGMMWMMIPCLILLGILFFGGDKLASSGYLWLIVIGVCVVPHIWMMFKGHGGHKDDEMEGKSDLPVAGNTAPTGVALEKPSGEKDEHKHSGCCH